jgi:hypothetical protein
MQAQNEKVIDQFYYPPRLEIVLPPPDKSNGKTEFPTENTPEISDSASVTLGNESRSIFRCQESTFTWRDFRQERIDETENKIQPRWLIELEDRIKVAAERKTPDPSFAVLYSEHLKRFMRPILTRQEVYSSDKRKFYVLLVEQPLMDFSGHKEMGTLLTILIFASRFRFDYLTPFFQNVINTVRIEDYERLIQEKKDMITTIESEAQQHGLTRPDKIIPIFDSSIQNEIRGLFTDWYVIREKLWDMFEDIPKSLNEMNEHRAQIIEIHQSLYKINTTFLKHSIDRYSELLNWELTNVYDFIDAHSDSGNRLSKATSGQKTKGRRGNPSRAAKKRTAKKTSKKSISTKKKTNISKKKNR